MAEFDAPGLESVAKGLVENLVYCHISLEFYKTLSKTWAQTGLCCNGWFHFWTWLPVCKIPEFIRLRCH